MITPDSNPNEYYVFIRDMCPYCSNTVEQIPIKVLLENNVPLSYRYCKTCNKIFEVKISDGISVKQLNDLAKKEIISNLPKEIMKILMGDKYHG